MHKLPTATMFAFVNSNVLGAENDASSSDDFAITIRSASEQPPGRPIRSRSGFADYVPAQVYLRVVDNGVVSNVRLVSNGHPMAPERVARHIVIKLGKQGWFTGRQSTHDSLFPRSYLCDSFPTPYYHETEDRLKKLYTAKDMLYRGRYAGKTGDDVELLLIPRDEAQRAYDDIADEFRRVVERTRIDNEMRVIEAREAAERMQAREHAHQKEMQLRETVRDLYKLIATAEGDDKAFYKQELEETKASIRALE
jgi:hypothetical protein